MSRASEKCVAATSANLSPDLATRCCFVLRLDGSPSPSVVVMAGPRGGDRAAPGDGDFGTRGAVVIEYPREGCRIREPEALPGLVSGRELRLNVFVPRLVMVFDWIDRSRREPRPCSVSEHSDDP